MPSSKRCLTCCPDFIVPCLCSLPTAHRMRTLQREG
nr:MAG TPA: hypothetical protein [Caudoviricetes sp.]